MFCRERPAQTTQDEDDTVDITVARLMATAQRLRNERDTIARQLEFVQAESRFKVEDLQAQLVRHQQESSINRLDNNPSQSSHTNNQLLDGYRVKLEQSQTRSMALALAVSHLQDNVSLLESKLDLEVSTSHQQSQLLSSLRSELTQTSSQDQEALASSLQEVEQLTRERDSFSKALSDSQNSKSELEANIEDLQTQLNSANDDLRNHEAQKIDLLKQVAELDKQLSSTKEDLVESEQRCKHLEATRFASLTKDDATKALQEEIEQLKARVLRRTEQIGLHQHEVKRLDTNLRLAEERLEELTTELDIANTEKAAMVEDCAMAREDREEVQRVLKTLEDEHESLKAERDGLKERADRLEARIGDLAKNREEASRKEEVERAELSKQCAALQMEKEVVQEALRVSELQTGELKDQLTEQLQRSIGLESNATDLHAEAMEIDELRSSEISTLTSLLISEKARSKS